MFRLRLDVMHTTAAAWLVKKLREEVAIFRQTAANFRQQN